MLGAVHLLRADQHLHDDRGRRPPARRVRAMSRRSWPRSSASPSPLVLLYATGAAGRRQRTLRHAVDPAVRDAARVAAARSCRSAMPCCALAYVDEIARRCRAASAAAWSAERRHRRQHRMSWQVDASLLYGVLLGGCLVFGVPVGRGDEPRRLVGITVLSGTQLWPTPRRHRLEHDQLVHADRRPAVRADGRDHPAQRRVRAASTRASRVLLSRVPGNLAQANIMACALFSAISGSSTATALTIGTVALPEMRKRGYSDALTLGTLTGGGALGNLIPPSHLPARLRARSCRQSVIDLFVATIIPGAIAVADVHDVRRVARVRDPSLVPARAPRHTARARSRSRSGSACPCRCSSCAIIGGMYFGVVTPTEAAGFGCVVALLLGAFYRELTWKQVRDVAADERRGEQRRDADHRRRADPELHRRAGRHRPRDGAVPRRAAAVARSCSSRRCSCSTCARHVPRRHLDDAADGAGALPDASTRMGFSDVWFGVILVDPGRARAAVAADRPQPLRGAVDRQGRLACRRSRGRRCRTRVMLSRAVVPALLLSRARVVAAWRR